MGVIWHVLTMAGKHCRSPPLHGIVSVPQFPARAGPGADINADIAPNVTMNTRASLILDFIVLFCVFVAFYLSCGKEYWLMRCPDLLYISAEPCMYIKAVEDIVICFDLGATKASFANGANRHPRDYGANS